MLKGYADVLNVRIQAPLSLRVKRVMENQVFASRLKAEEFVRKNPAEAQKVVADFIKADIHVLRDIWTDNNFSVSLDQSLILALEDESQWAMKSGLTGAKKIPNYLNFIYFDGLKAVKPEAVRILK